MKHSQRRSHGRQMLRGSALLVASVTTVVTAALGAGAATPTTTPGKAYAASTLSNALNLSILANAPGLSSLPSTVDTSDGALSLELLSANALVMHSSSGTPADVAGSKIALVGGTLAGLASASGMTNADPTATSSLADPGPNTADGTFGLPDPFTLGPAASGAVPELTAATVKSALSTTSSGTGVDLSALTLSDLTDTSSLSAGCTALTGQFSTLLGALATLTSTGTLPTGVLPTGLPTTLTGRAAVAVSAPVSIPVSVPVSVPSLPVTVPSGVPTALPTGSLPSLSSLESVLTAAQTEATAFCGQLLNGALISLKGLQSTSSISHVGSQEVSTAHVELGSASLLGGLCTLAGFDNTVTAKVGGTPGSASFTPVTTDGGIGSADCAGTTLGFDSTGLEGSLGVALGTALDPAINALELGLSSLNSALTMAGGLIQITADTPTNVSVKADGTSATGELSGLRIAVSVPTALPGLPSDGFGGLPTGVGGLGAQAATATPSTSSSSTATPTPSAGTSTAAASGNIGILTLAVGEVGAQAEIGTLTTKVLGETITKTPATAAPVPAGKLAFTGADLPATGGVALLLVLAGAYAIRRRRVGHDDI
jgi:hypothetical protein